MHKGFVGTIITLIVGAAVFYMLLQQSGSAKTIATGNNGLTSDFRKVTKTAAGG